MREFKFRAWNGEQYVSPDYIGRDGRAYWKENSIPTSGEPEQWTGLKDRNGADIYEGDIVRDHILNIKTRKPAKVARIFEVYWDEKTASFWQRLVKDPSAQYRSGSNFAAEKDGEVIGNIHEAKHE